MYLFSRVSLQLEPLQSVVLKFRIVHFQGVFAEGRSRPKNYKEDQRKDSLRGKKPRQVKHTVQAKVDFI